MRRNLLVGWIEGHAKKTVFDILMYVVDEEKEGRDKGGRFAS